MFGAHNFTPRARGTSYVGILTLSVYMLIYTVVKESWCRKVGGKGRGGISFAWRQHRFFSIDFSLLALSYEKLEKTGK